MLPNMIARIVTFPKMT